jgi:hypothetical protein
MYFTNAVLQLLVYCPPFGDLFSDLGRLTGQTGQRRLAVAQQDATVRLLDEFAYKKEDDDTEPFTPMYVYDAMKEKRQGIQEYAGAFLRPSSAAMLLICAGLPCIGRQQRDAEKYSGVYLDALDAKKGLGGKEPDWGGKAKLHSAPIFLSMQ